MRKSSKLESLYQGKDCRFVRLTYAFKDVSSHRDVVRTDYTDRHQNPISN